MDEPPLKLSREQYRMAMDYSHREVLRALPDCEEKEQRYLLASSLDGIERFLALGRISATEAERLRTELFDAVDALQPPGTPSSRGPVTTQ